MSYETIVLAEYIIGETEVQLLSGTVEILYRRSHRIVEVISSITGRRCFLSELVLDT